MSDGGGGGRQRGPSAHILGNGGGGGRQRGPSTRISGNGGVVAGRGDPLLTFRAIDGVAGREGPLLTFQVTEGEGVAGRGDSSPCVQMSHSLQRGGKWLEVSWNGEGKTKLK